MKVKCVRSELENGKRLNGWIRLNEIYHVLAIDISPEFENYYRIDSGRNGVALFEVEFFEIISNKLPSTWIAYQFGDKDLAIGPLRWFEDGYMEGDVYKQGFLERYYDRDPEAVKQFNEDVAAIIADDP